MHGHGNVDINCVPNGWVRSTARTRKSHYSKTNIDWFHISYSIEFVLNADFSRVCALN